jgi:hypothetical protein
MLTMLIASGAKIKLYSGTKVLLVGVTEKQAFCSCKMCDEM